MTKNIYLDYFESCIIIIMIVVLITHIIGAGIIIGGIVLTLVLLSSKKITSYTLSMLATFGEVIKYASMAQLVTGAILYLHETDKFRPNKFFWLKLVLYVISGILGGAIIQKQVKKLQNEDQPQTKNIHILFFVQLVIILLIVTIGVFLAESD